MSGQIQAAFSRMSTRERIMVGVMCASMLAFVLFLGVFLVGDRLTTMSDGLQAKRAALSTLMQHKDAYLKRSAEQGDPKKVIEGNDLDLTKFADRHAKAVGITWDAYKPNTLPIQLRKRAVGSRGDDKPDLMEEQLTVTFKRVGLTQLTAFLDRVDKEQKRPIAVKKLQVKTLWSDREQLTGSVTLATWKKPTEG